MFFPRSRMITLSKTFLQHCRDRTGYVSVQPDQFIDLCASAVRVQDCTAMKKKNQKMTDCLLEN